MPIRPSASVIQLARDLPLRSLGSPTMALLMDSSFFFSSRRRHTRSLCDWSSDVCSSDLKYPAGQAVARMLEAGVACARGGDVVGPLRTALEATTKQDLLVYVPFIELRLGEEIGRASCRERG